VYVSIFYKGVNGMKALTERQQKILNYIEWFMRKEGMAPTVYEIAKKFGIQSATAFVHIRSLQRKGYISRSSKARSISLLRANKPQHLSLTLSIPLLGHISAGTPLLSEENVDGELVYDSSQLPKDIGNHKLFALRVFGESMRDLGILDGDIIVAKNSPIAKVGDIVVAMVDNETTVKSFYLQNDKVELRPANSDFKAQLYPKEKVSIQGVVVGLNRSYE